MEDYCVLNEIKLTLRLFTNVVLTGFFKVFPELVTKDFFLSGESYAGYYLPYIAKRVVEASDAEKKVTPLVLHGLTIIDGVFSDNIGRSSASFSILRVARAHTQSLFDLQWASKYRLLDSPVRTRQFWDSIKPSWNTSTPPPRLVVTKLSLTLSNTPSPRAL